MSDANRPRLFGAALILGIVLVLAAAVTLSTPALVNADDSTPATGAPVIAGAAQINEKLSADARGIADGDGITNARFDYQWIRSDGTTDTDIEGATGRTYNIGFVDEGKTIKVRVSFTDDSGNAEAVTSAPTNTVPSEYNSPPTGAPTISGTAQVGQKLTVDTSGIADGDGLTNVSYGGSGWHHDESGS